MVKDAIVLGFCGVTILSLLVFFFSGPDQNNCGTDIHTCIVGC